MKLQGRELKAQMKGEDVRLLHSELRRLGYAIPESEYGAAVLGPETMTAVKAFQQKHGLAAAGTVDVKTAELINAEVAALTEDYSAEILAVLQQQDKKLADIVGGTNNLAPIDIKLGTHSQQLADIRAALEAQATQQTKVQDKLDAQTAKLAGIDSELDTHTAKMASIETKLDVQAGKLDAQTAKLTGIGSELQMHTAKFGSVEGKLDAQTGKLGNIEGRLKEHSDELQSIDERLVELNSVPPGLNTQGSQVAELHAQLARLGYQVPQPEVDAQLFGAGTQSALRRFQVRSGLAPSGALDDVTRAALARAAGGLVPGRNRVQGRLFLENGRPAPGATLYLYSRGFGGGQTLLGKAVTNAEGFYSLTYDPAGRAANFEARVLDPEGKEILISTTCFGAGQDEVLNLVAPLRTQTRAPEWTRLSVDLEQHTGGLDKLATAQETEERHDLALLSEATGWDARLVALAVRAAQLAQTTGVAPSALYGLLRTGLPSDEGTLALFDVAVVERALLKAAAAGIVGLSDDQIAGAKAAFEKYASARRLAGRARGALSTFGEFLDSLGLGEQQRQDFQRLYFAQPDGTEEFWSQVRAAGIPDQPLRLQGKLGYLTLNNQPLSMALAAKLSSLEDLVSQDLYLEQPWKDRLWQMAGGDEKSLEALIPPAYQGETPAGRLDAYARDLAHKVRVSFPTRVVARRVQTQDLVLGPGGDGLREPVSMVLTRASGLGFELGQFPVDGFVREHQAELFGGLDPSQMEPTVASIRRLQRLYQITPGDKALGLLSAEGFGSAFDVTQLSRQAFVDLFRSRDRPVEEAELVYRRAQQVTATALNLVTTTRSIRATPAVYAISGSPEERQVAQQLLQTQYPTLERVFGSLDFCACEHCRSVLSPAAYLVDLLQFVDPGDLAWQRFLDDWAVRHDGDPYLDTYMKPYDRLVQRRPDLPHLPLTCENTNTQLPYIDLVNEILEYFVAHGALGEGSVHDTGDATSAELVAEPQYIIPAAYDAIRADRYPLTLPFDLWLETVRGFCEYLNLPLWRLLEVLRRTDELFPAPGSGQAYGRGAVFTEHLGLSSGEHAILTRQDPQSAAWFVLYGYGAEEAALDELTSAKVLARRLEVSYRELVALLRTSFVNPRLAPVAGSLRRLHAGLDDVFRYEGHPAYPPFSGEEFQEFEDRLDALNLRDWLDAAYQRGDLNRILVLADPGGALGFEGAILRYADTTPIDPLPLLRLNLFARLWKKLGWSMDELDAALAAFLPRGLVGAGGEIPAENLGPALRTALLYLDHLKALDERLKLGKQGRTRLLTLWSGLPTQGENPLYAQLFLTRSILRSDPIFDDPEGNYLANPAVHIVDHLPALQAALGLSAGEIEAILAAAGLSMATSPLLLANVSLLYRHALLARALGLGIDELLALKALSATDPFAPLLPGAVTRIEEDRPFSQTLRFVGIADLVRSSGFRIADLDYLVRHHFDPVGKYRVDPSAPVALVRTLGAELRRIEDDPAVPEGAGPTRRRESIVRALVSNLRCDPALGEALLAGPQALVDPTPPEPGSPPVPLVDAFGVADELGLTAAFFAEPDASGKPLRVATMPAADTAARDAEGRPKPAETNSVRFEGYLEAPATGSYRFSITFGKPEVKATLFIGSSPDPVLHGKSGAAGDEIDGRVDLKGGSPQHLALEVLNLNQSDVALQVETDNLPLGSLARLVLSPQAAVERVERARTLLAKAVQLLSGLGLGEGEVRYLLSHAEDFDGLDLSRLPVSLGAGWPALAAEIFRQFLRLAGYARLKRELAAAGDDLVHVFESARCTFSPGAYEEAPVFRDAYTQLADLTRRDRAVVEATAGQLGFQALPTTLPTGGMVLALPDLADERGIARLWEALQAVEALGVPVTDLARWASPAPDSAVAQHLKNTLKARFEPDAWQRVARSIFDGLRAQQRDALVAHVMQHPPAGVTFQNANQLFEYFLVDPGMEPIVQTSRLRLAISSVQLFIQRCLLNLEPLVHPAAILNAEQWTWLKRYRLWEANRKIFLFPENWLEPEFRDDKTHLFRELESALLEGDVSNELAETAFVQYLRKLDELARLNIVSEYCEEHPGDPESNAVHVLGRTYSLPHKYFYRRYQYGMWTAWEPVTANLEGDHVAIVAWHERLYLFWVTFVEKADETQGIPNNTTPFTELSLSQVSSAGQQRRVDIHLHWSERFQGEWTSGESGSAEAVVANVPVSAAFAQDQVFIYEPEYWWLWGLFAERQEPLYIALSGGGLPRAHFRVRRNSLPEAHGPADYSAGVGAPYASDGHGATQYRDSGSLQVDWWVGSDWPGSEYTHYSFPVLENAGQFSFTVRSNPASSWGDLLSPFFFQNDRHTFFAQPRYAPEPAARWNGWVLPAARPAAYWQDEEWWSRLRLEAREPLPKSPAPGSPGDPVWVDSIATVALFSVRQEEDWLADEDLLLEFNGQLIGPAGRVAGTSSHAAQVAGSTLNPDGGGGPAPGIRDTAPGPMPIDDGSARVVRGSGLDSPRLTRAGRARRR